MHLRIPEDDQNLLLQLIRKDDAELDAIVGALQQMELALNESAIADALGSVCGLDELARVLVQLSLLRRRSSASWEEILESVRNALDQWKESDLDLWDRHRDRVHEILAVPRLTLTAKAIELAREHGNMLRRSRVIEDVRPVFDDAREKIEGAIVLHTLRLEYLGDARSRSISIALDSGDLRALRQECERALEKAERTKARVAEQWKVPVAVIGEEHDGE